MCADADFILEKNLIHESDRIVLALSGGADSVYLFYALLSLQKNFFFEFCTAHVNHMLRKEAKEEAAFVKALARKHGITHHETQIDILSRAAEEGCGIEETARKYRYEFLNQVAVSYNARWIFLAHHMDDQVETILMHLMRGSGLDGLVGMKEVNGQYVRPLLSVKKQTIIDTLTQLGYLYCEDESNQDTHYLRNEIRHVLIPLWNKISKQAYPSNLLQLSKVASEVHEFLQGEIEEFVSAQGVLTPHYAEIPLDVLQQKSKGFRKGLYRFLIQSLRGHLLDISYQNLLEIDKLCTSNLSKGETQLSASYFAAVGQNKFFIYQKRPTSSLHRLLKMGQNEMVTPYGSFTIYLSRTQKVDYNKTDTHFIDASKINGALYCRFRQAGDRFVPYGGSGSKKLKQFLNEIKMPFFLRDTWPLICDEKEIVAVPNYRISEHYKLTSETKDILQIEYI